MVFAPCISGEPAYEPVVADERPVRASSAVTCWRRANNATWIADIPLTGEATRSTADSFVAGAFAGSPDEFGDGEGANERFTLYGDRLVFDDVGPWRRSIRPGGPAK